MSPPPPPPSHFHLNLHGLFYPTPRGAHHSRFATHHLPPTHPPTPQVGLANFDVLAATRTWACLTVAEETKYKGKYMVWIASQGRHLPVRTIQVSVVRSDG